MVFSSLINQAVGFVFPRLCIVCRKKLSMDIWLCDACTAKLGTNHAMRDACPLCGQNRLLRRCTCEYNWEHPFELIYSVFDFDETIKTIVHEFKYGGQKRLACHMGVRAAAFIPRSFFEGMDAIVAVPLHFFRFLKRGFNQSDYFSRGIKKTCGAQLDDLQHVLVRKRATKTQTQLSRKLRQTNVLDAFAVIPKRKNLVRNKNLILVDDIVTTGATTGQCARALLEAGCGKIRVLSLARD